MIRPAPLQKGDKVAIVSPSWGGPSVFPHRYEAGLKQLSETFGVHAVEMPHARKPAQWLNDHPEARAQDLMDAFSRPDIKGIIASIGGEDSVRLLPHLNLKTIHDNPKIFLGYSDTTSMHFACYAAGLTSFYGPSIMAGFAENTGLHEYTAQSVRQTLFGADIIGPVKASAEWTDEHLDWKDPENQSIKRKMTPNAGWRSLNGTAKASGPMLGGCVEVLEMLKGSKVWPGLEQWKGAILFLETSEEKPSPSYFQRWLRNYASQGILQVLNGIVLGRPTVDEPEKNLHQYDDVLLQVVRDELGLKELPILTQVDFGHTDPMMVIPYGVRSEIDGAKASLTFLESGTAPRAHP